MEKLSNHQETTATGSNSWDSLKDTPFNNLPQDDVNTQNFANKTSKDDNATRINTAFTSLCDRLNIEPSHKNLEYLGNILGAENRRQKLLSLHETADNVYDEWNFLVNAEHVRRRSGLLVCEIFPDRFVSREEDFDQVMLKEESLRRQILSAPESKVLGSLSDRFMHSYHEFVEPTKEDVESLTFDEYKKRNGIETKPVNSNPTIGQKLKNAYHRIVKK